MTGSGLVGRDARAVAPGLGVVAAGVAGATALNVLAPAVSPLVVALLLGAAAANCGLLPQAFEPGLAFAAKRLLRVGIVLLGAQLAIPDVLTLGAPVLCAVLVAVAGTFLGTRWLGHLLGISRERSLLVAAGVSICGASAVAAMDSVTDSDEEDVMSAIAMVTLFGSLAIVVLPLVHGAIGMPEAAFGMWAGGSVHEVAQVVATAGTVGSAALGTAVVVKLTRVVLLAPMIAGISLWRRRRAAAPGAGRPPLLPLFVAGFLAMMTLRSVGAVPEPALAPLATVGTLLFTAALFGLGAAVRLRALARAGWRPVLLGGTSSLLIALLSLAGVLTVW